MVKKQGILPNYLLIILDLVPTKVNIKVAYVIETMWLLKLARKVVIKTLNLLVAFDIFLGVQLGSLFVCKKSHFQRFFFVPQASNS